VAASGGLWGVLTSAMEGHGPAPSFAGLPGADSLLSCGGPFGNCGGIGGGWTEETPVAPEVRDPGRFIMDATSGKSVVAARMACGALPSGRIVSIPGNGNLVGLTGSLDLVTNFRTGQVTGFFSPGYFAGVTTMGASLTGGLTFGDLGPANSNFNRGFTGISGGVGYIAGGISTSSGGPASPLSGIKPSGAGHVTTVALGVQTPGRGIMLSTTYSLPTQVGKFWTLLLDPLAAALYAANQLCAGAGY